METTAGMADLYFVLIMVVTACIAGYAAGFFGMGGGVVLVPVLLTLYHFAQTPSMYAFHQAVGTSLSLVIPAGVGAVIKQVQLHNVDYKFCKGWLPWVVLGAIIGGLLVSYANPQYLKIIFICYLFLSICIVIFYRGKSRHDGLPKSIYKTTGGVIIGGFSVMLGIGGGTLTVPFLRLNHYPMKRSLALSSVTTIAIGVVGCIAMILLGLGKPGRLPYSLGYVNWLSFLIIAPFMLWLSPHGVRKANQIDKHLLQMLYVVFLAVVMGYMIYHVIAG